MVLYPSPLMVHVRQCSSLICSLEPQKAMTSTSRPTTTATTATIALAEMDHTPVNLIDPVGPLVPQAPASSTSSVALPVSARRVHPQPMPQVHSQKNTRGPCRQLKTRKVIWVTNSRITIRSNERHRAAPMAMQHSALVHDNGHVMRTFYPMRWKSWKAMSEEIA